MQTELRFSTTRLPFLVTALLALLLAWSIGPGTAAEAKTESSSARALDWAYRFAAAIDPDPKDKAKAQESVVRDYAGVGLLDETVSRAEQIDGWRQGAVFADLATEFARAGRTEEARRLLARSEQIRARTDGWQNTRIYSHTVRAVAALGDTDRSREIAMGLVSLDGQQYLGRSVASIAMGLADNGEFDKAREELAKLKDSRDIYETWWRTAAYLNLAGQQALPMEERLEALEQARRSAEDIAGWKRGEMLATIADEYCNLGKRKLARPVLREAETLIQAVDEARAIKATLLAGLARSWALAGDNDHALELLRTAEPLVANSMTIEQPGIRAVIAAAYASAGDLESADRLYDEALSSAASLVNARPRALAVVKICRSMARQEYPLDPTTEERLDALYNGLTDPW